MTCQQCLHHLFRIVIFFKTSREVLFALVLTFETDADSTHLIRVPALRGATIIFQIPSLKPCLPTYELKSNASNGPAAAGRGKKKFPKEINRLIKRTYIFR